MERWVRRLERMRPEPAAAAAATLSALLLVGALGASLSSGEVRASALAAAGGLLLLVGTGLSLYAWRPGVAGRSR